MPTLRRISTSTALLATLCGLPPISYAASPEQLCTELGASCICSEPFQMTGFDLFSDWGHDPNDSTAATKQCGGETGSGHVISRSSGAPVLVGADPSVLGALPPGHNVQRYMRGADGHTGIFEMNQLVDGSFTRNRIAVRWYLYFSPDYAFEYEGGCTNSMKWFTAYPGAGQWGYRGTNGPPLIYGLAVQAVGGVAPGTYAPYFDCCNWGPIGVSGGLGGVTRGKWYRFEAILSNWTSTSTTNVRFQGFRKNVTDNEAEEKIIDTFEACPTSASYPSGCANSSVENWPGGGMQMAQGPLNRVEINFFRYGTCDGWKAISHMLVAAWSTDAGQRIGPAVEIEGSGDAVSPGAPQALTAR